MGRDDWKRDLSHLMNAAVESLERLVERSDLSFCKILDEGFFLWIGSWVAVPDREIMFYFSLFSIYLKEDYYKHIDKKGN